MKKTFTFLKRELLVLSLFLAVFCQTVQGQTLVQQGVSLFHTQDYEAAHEHFVKYILQNTTLPKNDLRLPEFYRAACEIYLQKEGVEFLIERFESKYPKDSLVFELHELLGNWHFTKENWHKAFSHLQRAQNEKNNDLELQYRLAISAQRINRRLEAQRWLEKVKNREKNLYTYASARMLGEIYFEEKEWETALNNFLFSLKEGETFDPQTRLQIAECYYRLGRLEEFEEYATKNLAVEHLRKGHISMWLGEAYFDQSRFVESSKYLMNYVENTHTIPRDILYKLGFSFLRISDSERAIKYLEKVKAEKDKLYQLTTLALGEAYWSEFKNSLHDRDGIMTDDPETLMGSATENMITAFNLTFIPMAQEKALYGLTEIFLVKRQNERAIELADEYLLRFGKNGAFVGKINELKRKATMPSTLNLRQRVAELEKADLANFKIKSELQTIYAYLAEKERQKGNVPQAANDAEQSLRHVTDKVLASETHYWLAEAKTHLAEYQKAIEHYSQVSEKNRLYPYVRLGMGRAYFFQEKYDEAIKHLRQYVKMYGEEHAADSSLQTALLYLGKSYQEQKRYTEALEQYEKIDLKKTFWKKDEFKLRKAEVLKTLQHNHEALALLDSLITMHPKSEYVPDALLRQGMWQLDLDHPAKALKPLSRLIERYPKHKDIPEAYYYRSKAHWFLKDSAKAIADAEYVGKNHPTHPITPQAIELLKLAKNKSLHKPLFLPSGGTGETFAPTRKVLQGGQCSHYADKFIGKKMANGQVYDPKAYTAAHLTLPLGTEIEVKNLKNGKTVRVTITDRGPYGNAKRILDLSHIAAEEIGFKDGVADIEISIVK